MKVAKVVFGKKTSECKVILANGEELECLLYMHAKAAVEGIVTVTVEIGVMAEGITQIDTNEKDS